MKKNTKTELKNKIKTLMQDLSEKNLKILHEQTKIISKNQKINAEIESSQKLKKQMAEFNEKIKKQKTEKPVRKTLNKSVKLEPADKNNKNFILLIGNQRKMLGETEILHLIKIVKTNNTDSGATNGLYSWFIRERSDILHDCGINDKTYSKLIPQIIKILKTQFRVR